jgi:aryl carrier-like protein
VRVAQADVADAQQLAQVLSQVASKMAPLRGILHAAGTVDDGMLPEQTMARFASVMAPKVRGTWNLHTLTAKTPLDFFVMFSSGAALLGSPGQGNYAAANSFMDALAEVRRANGQHALSINWGSWAEVGMAAEVSEQHRRRWASLGLAMIAPDEGVQMLQDMLYGSRAAQMAALPLNRARLPSNLGPFFSALLSAPVASAEAVHSGTADILNLLGHASAGERQDLLATFLGELVVKVLALGASYRVDMDRSLMDMGMDSLMAMELRNRIQTTLKVRVAVADLLQGPSLKQLSAMVLASPEMPGGAAMPHATAVAAETWEEGSL